MGKRGELFDHMTGQGDTGTDSLLKLPVVELVSDCRVLVENHFGIRAYCRDEIVVNIKFGYISVCGKNLQVLKMTREQLVICGKIESVSVHREEKHEFTKT